MDNRPHVLSHSIVLDKQYFNFAAAHFLIFEDGQREPLHGHNYRAEVELEAALGPAELVFDFIEVKPLFKACCDELDHKVILPSHNPYLTVATTDRRVTVQWEDDEFMFPRADVVMLDSSNSSSEALAEFLCKRFVTRLLESQPNARLKQLVVTVSESPGQAARVAVNWPDVQPTITAARNAMH